MTTGSVGSHRSELAPNNPWAQPTEDSPVSSCHMIFLSIRPRGMLGRRLFQGGPHRQHSVKVRMARFTPMTGRCCAVDLLKWRGSPGRPARSPHGSCKATRPAGVQGTHFQATPGQAWDCRQRSVGLVHVVSCPGRAALLNVARFSTRRGRQGPPHGQSSSQALRLQDRLHCPMASLLGREAGLTGRPIQAEVPLQWSSPVQKRFPGGWGPCPEQASASGSSRTWAWPWAGCPPLLRTAPSAPAWPLRHCPATRGGGVPEPPEAHV